MADMNGTTNDDMNANESAEFSDEPPEQALDETRSASSGSGRYRRSVSGLHRNERAVGMSGPSLRRSSKDKYREKILHLRIIVAVLVVTLVAAAGVVILSWNQQSTLAARVFELDSKLRITSEDLNEARDLMATQEAELRSMRTGLLPGLTQLELDTQVDIDQKYLYKLTFLESGVADNKQLEYHAILRNTGATPVVPRVKIILFDRKGIQTGMALIGDADLDLEGNTPALKPGETRSYMSILTTDPDTESAYFLAEVN